MLARKILVVSLGLNLLLGTLYLLKRSSQPSPPKPSTAVKIVRQTIIETKTNAPATRSFQLPMDAFHWRNLESDDYPTYIANLRSVGCPERTLQHIILQDLETLYRDKQSLESWEPTPWMTGSQRDAEIRERKVRQAMLMEEKSQVMKTLLGREIDREARKEWVEQSEIAWFLAFLTDDQSEQTLSIGTRLGRQMEATFGRNRLLLEEDIQRAENAFSTMQQEFAKIASPQEVEEALLRMTLIMSLEMNGGLKSIKLSPEELRRLLLLQKEEEDPFKKLLHLLQNGDKQRSSFSPAFVKDARQLLGEQRFLEFICAQDPGLETFRTAIGPAKAPETLVRVLEIQQATMEEAESIRANPNLSRAEKRAELRAIQQMSREAITQLGGQETATEYFNGQTGWWEALRNP